MKTLCIALNKNIDIGEFSKAICFVSEEIMDYHISGHKLNLIIDKESDGDNIKEEVIKYSQKYISTKGKGSKCIKVFNSERSEGHEYFDQKLMKDNNGVINNFGKGLISLNGVAIKLYRFFDNAFRNIAHEVGGIEKMYPVLLPLEEYQVTGYLKNSAQYSIFCCCPGENIHVLEEVDRRVKDNNVQDILKEPNLALSPSACFHTYIECKNKKLESEKTFTFVQNVFRNEGRLNFNELVLLSSEKCTTLLT